MATYNTRTDDGTSKKSSRTSTVVITCPVCQEDYEEPKLLPCAHRFCRKCLVTWIESNKGPASCPLCHRRIKSEQPSSSSQFSTKCTTGKNHATSEAQESQCAVPSNVRAHRVLAACDSRAFVDNLPTDLVLVAIVESTKKLRPPHVCSICQGIKMAVDLCMYCEDKLCELCSLHHSRMAITRHHDIQAIDKLTPGELASSRRERCQTHPDQFLELYCPVHFQPTCFSCYPVRHGGCGAIETAADAANRQREVVQKQMGKLKHASEEIKRHQKETTQSQQQARKDLTNLITRLSSCLRDFENEMLEKIQDIPVTAGLQKTCAEVEEWNWLAAAHQQLVSDTFSTANDVNMLHVSGALAARAARLAAEAPTPQDSSRVQLVVDEGGLPEVEQKIKTLAQLNTPSQESADTSSPTGAKPASQTTTKSTSASFLESLLSDARVQSASNASVTVAECSGSVAFDPFTSQPSTHEIYCSSVSHMIQAICVIDNDRLLVAEENKDLTMVTTKEPFKHRLLTSLPYYCRAMTLLGDGQVAITTETNIIYFVDVKRTLVKLRKVRTKKGYWGIAPGLNDTLIVSYDGTPPSVDVITREGRLVTNLTPVTNGKVHNIGRPRDLCRWGDCVVVVDIENNRLLKTAYDTSTRDQRQSGFSWIHPPFLDDTSHVATDRMGRLYITHRGELLVTNAGSRWTVFQHYSSSDIDISLDGNVFVVGGSPAMFVYRCSF